MTSTHHLNTYYSRYLPRLITSAVICVSDVNIYMSPTIGAQELRMRGLLLRIIINASAILVASRIISGIQVDNTLTLLGAGLTLGLINATVRPILLILTFPLTLVTLGLFIFILNAICLELTAWFVPGFEVDNLGAALLGALSISVVSWIPNIFVSSR